MSLFSHAEVDRVSAGGGVIGVTVSNQATNGGSHLAVQATSTPTPCRECYISHCPSIATGAGNAVHFAIDVSVNVSLGATVPKSIPGNSLGPGSSGVLRLPIDDVSKLWFFNTSDTVIAKVGITYRT